MNYTRFFKTKLCFGFLMSPNCLKKLEFKQTLINRI